MSLPQKWRDERPWGPAELEAIINAEGDHPDLDERIRTRVQVCQLMVLAARSDEHVLLHCTVPVDDEPWEIVPAFTRVDHVMEAVQINPSWQAYPVVWMSGAQIMSELAPHEWLAINPWSGHEFKLPATPPEPEMGGLDL